MHITTTHHGSKIKIHTLLGEVFNTLDRDREATREALEAMIDGEIDTFCGDFRIIHEDEVLTAVMDSISSDEYVLGCFNADFLAPILGCPVEVLERMGEVDGFEAIGYWIINTGKLEEVATKAIEWDGAGHFLSGYDGSETVVKAGPHYYHIFRN